jgi:hypothetical protein
VGLHGAGAEAQGRKPTRHSPGPTLLVMLPPMNRARGWDRASAAGWSNTVTVQPGHGGCKPTQSVVVRRQRAGLTKKGIAAHRCRPRTLLHQRRHQAAAKEARAACNEAGLG